MIVSEACRSDFTFFCPLCGTNSISDKGINACPHFEGFTTDDEIGYDKNGILKKAQEKAEEIQYQVNEYLDKIFDEKEHEGDNRDKYWASKNKAIQESYTAVGYPQNGPVKEINGTGMVRMLDILKSDLDDSYFAFDSWAPMPSGIGGFNLYHLVELDEEE